MQTRRNKREGRAPEGVPMTPNHPVADDVSYTSLGHTRLLNGVSPMGTFVICKGGQDAPKVVIANSGRARLEKTNEHCS
jgi:hypothetical protein